jgi:SAM-dependent methyltransferase
MQTLVAEDMVPPVPDPVVTGRCPLCRNCQGEDFLEAPDRFHGLATLYRLLRCPACSLVWLGNPPLPEEMSRHYGEDYDRSVAAGGAETDHWRGRREVLAQYKSGGTILDLGCSSGGFLHSLPTPAWKLYGIEMSGGVARDAHQGAQIFVGDILAAPFPAESFDAITCFHVFEHLYHPREVLARVSRWLKPGGVFYAMMPNIDSAGARIFRSYWYALELPRHLYHFSPATLKNLAGSVGLQEVSITTHREVFIEASSRYILDDVCRTWGIARRPMAKARPASLPWKVARKMFRISVLPVLNGLAGLAGDGESIHAVFRKKDGAIPAQP